MLERSWHRDVRDMAQVAWPIVLINVGMQAMGFVDTLMVGPLGGTAIASVALGNFYFFNVTIFGIGLIFAIDPIVSQAVGAGDHEAVARGVQRGLVLAVVMTVVSILALAPAAPLFRWLGQPDDLIDPTGVYVQRRLWGVLPMFLFVVLRQALQALGPVRPIIVAVVVGNLVNAAANWALIGGHAGMPALGVEGSGVATSIASWVMAALLAWMAWPVLGGALRPWRPAVLDRAPMWRMVALGFPMAVQFFFETFAFGVTAVLMGWMGTVSLAGHEIALNLAAMTFMVPLGISGAAAVVVGRAIGRGDMPAARRDAIAAIVCGVGFMCLTAIAFLGAPEWLATRFTRESATLAVAVTLIPLAGWFQVFDGLQAVTSGVLRGTGDTRIPAILHLIAFWGIGVPLGVYLGFRTDYRERGLWIGLVAGLMAASLLQSARAYVRLRADVQRVRVE
jgi:MATE family multidrug resistance protein